MVRRLLAPPLTIPLRSLDATAVTVAIDDGDNSPLPLDPPRLLLPARRIRFYRSNDVPLRLLYGAPGVAAPRYDLALLAPRVLGASAQELTPEPEAVTGAGETAGRSGTAAERWVFWGALLLAVAVLLGILARLLRAGAGADQATAPGAGPRD